MRPSEPSKDTVAGLTVNCRATRSFHTGLRMLSVSIVSDPLLCRTSMNQASYVRRDQCCRCSRPKGLVGSEQSAGLQQGANEKQQQQGSQTPNRGTPKGEINCSRGQSSNALPRGSQGLFFVQFTQMACSSMDAELVCFRRLPHFSPATDLVSKPRPSVIRFQWQEQRMLHSFVTSERKLIAHGIQLKALFSLARMERCPSSCSRGPS